MISVISAVDRFCQSIECEIDLVQWALAIDSDEVVLLDNLEVYEMYMNGMTWKVYSINEEPIFNCSESGILALTPMEVYPTMNSQGTSDRH